VEVKRDIQHVARPDTAAGVDLGVKTLAVMADSHGKIRTVPNPRHLDAALKRLRRASRVVSRRRGPDRRTGQKPSRRWEKANAARNRVHHRVANLRADALHKLTTAVAAEYGTVVVEDLNVPGMLRTDASPAKSPTPDSARSAASSPTRPAGTAAASWPPTAGLPLPRPVPAAAR
jgi:putative transposase